MSGEICDICHGGDDCGRGPRECPEQRASALEAGIPADVIDGKRKLSEYSDREAIEIMCGREMPVDDLIDAGRGRLVRR